LKNDIGPTHITFWPPETPGFIDPLKYTRMFTVNVNMTKITFWLSINFHRYLIFMNTIFFENNLFTTLSVIVCQESSIYVKYTNENEWDTSDMCVKRHSKLWLFCYKIIAENYNDNYFWNTEAMSCMCKIDLAKTKTVRKICI